MLKRFRNNRWVLDMPCAPRLCVCPRQYSQQQRIHYSVRVLDTPPTAVLRLLGWLGFGLISSAVSWLGRLIVGLAGAAWNDV